MNDLQIQEAFTSFVGAIFERIQKEDSSHAVTVGYVENVVVGLLNEFVPEDKQKELIARIQEKEEIVRHFQTEARGK